MDGAGKPLSDLLRELREGEGRSLREVARHLEVVPSYLSRVERGEKPLSASMKRRAAEYYGVAEETLALAGGEIPEDIVAILRENPGVVEELRRRFSK